MAKPKVQKTQTVICIFYHKFEINIQETNI